MPKVMANGINIYYELMGKGDPLALIGGSLFGRQNFAMVWEGLAESFQLISYDQRGYGQTDRPLMRYDLDIWADDLAALLDELQIERVHVMGTSAGGMIALKFAGEVSRPLHRRGQRLRLCEMRYHAPDHVPHLAPHGADLGAAVPSSPIT